MLNLLDIAPEPIIEPATKSLPWISAYIAIGVLVCVAVLIVIKLIKKAKK